MPYEPQHEDTGPSRFLLPLAICNYKFAYFRSGVPITFNVSKIVTPWLMFFALRMTEVPLDTRMYMSLLLTLPLSEVTLPVPIAWLTVILGIAGVK